MQRARHSRVFVQLLEHLVRLLVAVGGLCEAALRVGEVGQVGIARGHFASIPECGKDRPRSRERLAGLGVAAGHHSQRTGLYQAPRCGLVVPECPGQSDLEAERVEHGVVAPLLLKPAGLGHQARERVVRRQLGLRREKRLALGRGRREQLARQFGRRRRLVPDPPGARGVGQEREVPHPTLAPDVLRLLVGDPEVDHRASAAAAGVRTGIPDGQPDQLDLAQVELDEDGLASEAVEAAGMEERDHAVDVLSRVGGEEALQNVREDPVGLFRRQRRRRRLHDGGGLGGGGGCDSDDQESGEGNEDSVHQRVRRRPPEIGLTGDSPAAGGERLAACGRRLSRPEPRRRTTDFSSAGQLRDPDHAATPRRRR